MSKKIITKKQNTILTLILTFRFMNSKQVQKFLQHKDHRRSNEWLKDLVKKGYIDMDFKPVFGTLTKPAIYNLTALGRSYIRNTYPQTSKKYLSRLRDDSERSKAYKIKCQILADCFLISFENEVSEFVEFIQSYLNGKATLKKDYLHFFTPVFYESLEFTLISKLKSDAYMYYRTAKGITHSFMYVLDSYIPQMKLRYTLIGIFTLLHEEYWENEDIESLHIYFICPNNAIIIYLRRLLAGLIEKYYGSAELVFHFATRNQLYNRQIYHKKETGWISISSGSN